MLLKYFYDPVLAQAHVLTALQAVISRSRPAGEPSILSFGRVIGDGAGNVVPDEVRIDGTFRAMDDEWRFRAHDLIRRTAEHAAASQAYRRRIWDEELYYKAPAFSALMAEEFYDSKGGFSSTGGFRGWTYSYCMDPAKDAQYGWTKKRLSEAVQARDARVEEAARNL